MSTTDWRKAREQAKKAEADRPSLFCRLQNPGETAVVVFVGEFLRREVVYLGGKYVDYDPAQHGDETPLIRWKSNVFTIARSPSGEGSWSAVRSMQIIELSNKTFLDASENFERFPLDRWAYRIKRKSQNEYTAGVEKEITPEIADLIDKTPLHDLSSDGKSGGGGQAQAQHDDHGEHVPGDDLPF